MGYCDVIEQFLSKCVISQEELDCGLHAATEFGHELIVERLLNAGGNPNFKVQSICKATGREIFHFSTVDGLN